MADEITAPDHVVADLLRRIQPPGPDPRVSPEFAQACWRADVRNLADRIWREAWVAGGVHGMSIVPARTVIDEVASLRAAALPEGGVWVTEYGAVNDMTGEFVPFSWACTNHPDAARAVAETVGKEAMQQRVWRGKPEPIPATEATDGD